MRTAIYTALLYRLVVVHRHMIDQLGGFLRFLKICEKYQTAGHLVTLKPRPAVGHLATAFFKCFTLREKFPLAFVSPTQTVARRQASRAGFLWLDCTDSR